MSVIACHTTNEAAEIIRVERHLFKALRETGLLTGRRSGNGYVYDDEELTEFVRMARGFDLSNDSKIRYFAPIIKQQNKKGAR